MNRSEFKAYKNDYCSAIRQVLSGIEANRFDMAAFPAYSHRNPLIRWLFWQRLRIVMNYIQSKASVERVLDFGCGSGVMLPFLSEVSEQVVGADVDLTPITRMQEYIPLDSNVQVIDTSIVPLTNYATDSFDFIIALDVLEHVNDIESIMLDLIKLLKINGQVIISGPTENVFYRVGRKVAGPEFSGAYHKRGIVDIRTLLNKYVKTEKIATLYWPVPLFEIFVGTK